MGFGVFCGYLSSGRRCSCSPPLLSPVQLSACSGTDLGILSIAKKKADESMAPVQLTTSRK